MSWIAMHYVKVNGQLYTRGEIIGEEINDKKAERLLRLGAIRRMIEEPTAEAAEENEVKAEPKPEKKPAKRAAKPASKPAPVQEEEADDDGDAPEIDIMDGIVSKARRSKK